MGRVVASVILPVDGYLEGPGGVGDLDWLGPYDEEIVEESLAVLGPPASGILLGRTTYEGFRDYWPYEQDAVAKRMNALPKYVVGRLTSTPWGSYGNASPVDGEAEAGVRALKAATEGDLVILASGRLASSLLRLGLVDSVRILQLPVVLGAGTPYFRDLQGPLGLSLAEVRPYPSGSVRLTYDVNPS